VLRWKSEEGGGLDIGGGGGRWESKGNVRMWECLARLVRYLIVECLFCTCEDFYTFIDVAGH